MSNFLAEASEIQNDLVAIRRHIHQEPEITAKQKGPGEYQVPITTKPSW